MNSFQHLKKNLELLYSNAIIIIPFTFGICITFRPMSPRRTLNYIDPSVKSLRIFKNYIIATLKFVKNLKQIFLKSDCQADTPI